MPIHIPKDHYVGNTHEYVPNAHLHPDIQHHDHPSGTEHYLLPGLFIVHNGAAAVATYPGPCVYYITEGEVEYEDKLNTGNPTVLRAGSILHVEEGSLIRWSCNSPTGVKGFGVAYVPVSVKSINDLVSPEQ